jgi:hypothetical protein
MIRRILACTALAAMIWLVFFTDGRGLVMQWLQDQNQPHIWIIFITALIYAIALSVPFLPAVELGWLVMAAFGPIGILSIWMATPFGLLFAFCIGYWLREWPFIQRLQHRFRTKVAEATGSSPGDRMLRLASEKLTSHPYIALGILVNVPGNWVIGGGGGIGLMAGASGLYHPLKFVLVLIPATGVVALLMLIGVHAPTVG